MARQRRAVQEDAAGAFETPQGPALRVGEAVIGQLPEFVELPALG